MKVCKIIFSLIIVFSCIFTIFFGRFKINEEIEIVETSQYKGVLTVWQIDTFEGGRGSRRQFLLKVARDFEKQNNGLLIMVINHTITSAEESLKKGKAPDMISFGNGLCFNDYTEYSSKNIFPSCIIGEKQVGAIWAMGKYVLISNLDKTTDFNLENKKIVVSYQNYTLSEVAFALENFYCKNIEYKSTLDAYIDFVSGKVEYLFGTQRDIIRLNNRGFNYAIKPIESFSDLNQYIIITSKDGEKIIYSKKYIDFLLSKKIQSKLKEIGLFSYIESVQYDDKGLNELNDVLPKNTLSMFIEREKISLLREKSKQILGGDKSQLEYLKKHLIKS